MAFLLKVAFCYGLQVWPSVMAFWCGAFWRGLLLWPPGVVPSGVAFCYGLLVEKGLSEEIPPHSMVDKWMVCILLECFPVYFVFMFAVFSPNGPLGRLPFTL